MLNADVPSQKIPAEPKWAAVVDDRLIPLPRQRLQVSVVLQQSGAPPNTVLVRDYNSPNDIGFEEHATIDLQQGNVFRTSDACQRSANFLSHELPKLAFVVDDHWEVTIQAKQTGLSLRGLLEVNDSLTLLRDYESPVDKPIDDSEIVNFADGPVFTTKPKKPHEITIIVEGTPYPWSKTKISYSEVVTLFDPNYPQHPEITYSVKFKKGPNHKPEGILSPGASIQVKDHMVFNVSATGQS